jgi:hypothetical protein
MVESDKIVENIINNPIFDKIKNMKSIMIGFACCSSIFGLFTLYNAYTSHQIKNKISSIENTIKENEHLPRVYYRICMDGYQVIYKISRHQLHLEKKYDHLNEKIDKVIALLEDKKESL